MQEPISPPRILAPKRAALATLAAAMALVLILGVVVAARQAPDFGSSYKTGPLFARKDDQIRYSIVVSNTGGPVQGVILSDTIPKTTEFVPQSCFYLRHGGFYRACGPLDRLWKEDFDTGDRITTFFEVVVTAGTLQWPLTNCAHLSWDDEQMEMCFTTIANPLTVCLPFVARNWSAP